jgi:hypothetical protein
MSSEVSIELSSHPQSAFEPKESRQSTERQVDENDIPQTGETEGRILEPTDGGPSAWKILISAFIFEAVLWGEHSGEQIQIHSSTTEVPD